MRGSGLHHSIGWPSLYHGKIPFAYAWTRRATERSPPAASRPFGSLSARPTGGKSSSFLSHGIMHSFYVPQAQQPKVRTRAPPSSEEENFPERSAVGERRSRPECS